MKYYLVDTTQSTDPQFFNNVADLVKHLEGTVQRKFRLTRKQYMQNLIDLGYGYDDPEGATFASSMGETFSMGSYQDGRLIRSNIHETSRNTKYQNEYGN
jgi:hypothetical protein